MFGTGPSPNQGAHLNKGAHTSNQGAHHNQGAHTNTTVKTSLTLVQTVQENKSHFTKREIAAADQARSLYRMLGRPSQQKFEDILSKNIILNCPVTVDDAKRALIIYGPDIATLKGKTNRGQPATRIPDFTAVPIPAPILMYHQNITLCIDFFFVQGQCFLHTISRKLQYRTVHPVDNRHASTIHTCIDRVVKQYTSRGFIVNCIIADIEFECVRTMLQNIHLDTTPPEEHVGEVERSIRTIKERVRATVHGLPFTRIPRLMVRELVIFSIDSLNQLPADEGVSNILSPHVIMTGRSNPDFNNFRIEFGAYAQIYEPGDMLINNMRSRTTGAIALSSTGNSQGHMHFLSLASGKRVTRGKWTVLPMPEEAILRVEQLATIDGQPPLQNSRMIVEWRPDSPFEDDDDPDYVFDPSEEDDEFTMADYEPDTSIRGDATFVGENHQEAIIFPMRTRHPP
jgi:hypothetical protein